MGLRAGILCWLHSALAAVLLLGAGRAAGQVRTVDSFEGPNLYLSDVPPGPWYGLEDHTPGPATLGLDPRAARTGLLGLRAVDQHVAAGSANTINLIAYSDAGTSQFFRFFVRPSGDAGTARVHLVQLNALGTPIGTVSALSWSSQSGYRFLCYDRQGVEQAQVTPPGADAGAWAQVEMELVGLGTPDGGCRAWFDGVSVVNTGNLDFTGLTPREVSIGVCWGSLAFRGEIDFDDALATAVRPVGYLALETPPAAAVGECFAARLSLVNSQGVPVTSPDDVPVAMFQTGVAATLSATAGCSPAGVDAVIPGGAPQALLYARAGAPGDLVLGAKSPTHGSAAAVIRILDTVPDGGDGGAASPGGGAPPDGGFTRTEPISLHTGCGCGATEGLWLPVVMLVVAGLRRRSRGARTAPGCT